MGAGAKDIVGLDGAAEQVREDAVGLQQVEQLAGHHRAETVQAATPQVAPFVVGAGMADQAIGLDLAGRDRAEQLHFLAAHDVGAAVPDIGHARDDGFAFTGPGEFPRQFVEPGGAGNVRRLGPAAVGADHAGHQQGQVAEAIPNFGDRRRELALVD